MDTIVIVIVATPDTGIIPDTLDVVTGTIVTDVAIDPAGTIEIVITTN
jgi:hypothetical protein